MNEDSSRRARAVPATLVPVVQWLLRCYTRLNVWVFKKSRGRLWRHFPGGYPICVVGMKGAKSGARRELGLIHLTVPDGNGSIYLVASQGGLPRNPAWYYNLRANPELTVMHAGGTQTLRARELAGEERDAAWHEVGRQYPPFADYQARTEREIPVLICE